MHITRNPTRNFYRPIIGFLAATSAALLLYAIWLCLHNISLMSTKGTQFIGLSNFVRLATDWRGVQALGRTALFVLLATSIEVVLGIAIAMFLDQDFRGKKIVRAVILVPMIMTPVIAGLTWRFLFNAQSGMINYWLSLVGIAPVDWLGNPSVALYAVLIADIWQWTPFVVLLAMATLETIPKDLVEAARMDGASEIRVIWHIILPMLRRTLGVAALIRAIDSVKAFDLFYIMTKGGPALSTETQNLYGYTVAFTNFDISYAMTIALFLTIVTNVALLVLTRFAMPKGIR
ncbi:sugar ABC transporter permease (plasmid) [Rhizobium sp. 32-5/1]|uniref:carbohydrate ABC transporter permease n=1 Tax=Rhizobium sp. 32-5/1 TaxID=3019602 RepID=UPI00240E67E1|nr:sugar ABC transporter permease [Rhizobium sp. 32-5/1]WEZ85436.1 sugar ABC transporter permease [Rhizobium sp. 32-5/1]